jgi:hypothetical protein
MTDRIIPRRAVLDAASATWAWWSDSNGYLTVADAVARSEGWVIEPEQPEPEPGARIVPAVEQFAEIARRLKEIAA